MRRTTLTVIAAVAIIASACTVAGETTSGPGGGDRGPDVHFTSEGVFAAAAAVSPFDSCDAFLDFTIEHALEFVGPYGFGGYGYPVMFDDVAAVAEETDGVLRQAPTTTVAAGGSAGVDYSGTNVQVAGIDEPDVVKTDGERVFIVAAGKLYWVDATGEPEIVDSLGLDGWGQQLFLSGDRLLVLTTGGGYGGPVLERSADIVPGGSPRAQLVEVDVSSPGDMTVVRTLTVDGSILSSRMADGSIRVVVRSGPVGFDWNYPEGSGLRSERKATEANRKLVERSSIENWVPWYVLEDEEAGTTSDGPLLGCDQIGHPDEFSGLSMLTVLTIDLSDGLSPGNGVGLLADGQTIYMSQNNLYVATSPWMAMPIPLDGDVEESDSFSTAIHVFDVSDPDVTTYVASGEVEGSLLSQWSLDEYDGVLRVVTTDEPAWGWRGDRVPDTTVTTLERRGTDLVKRGSVGGLGKNERVYAVRFIEDKGYVVTFRQVDPLYVVDLSDPDDPTLAGELKINGYSAYLHPIGDDLLLGVGQDATDEGRTLGLQVSVFDVSDPADPRRLARMTFDDSNSDAEWDHHAFLWWAPEDIAVLPMQRWSWAEDTEKGEHFSGAVVVEATGARVVQVGTVSHPTADPDCPDCWQAPISRSLVIGDRLFTISEAGVLASDLDALDEGGAWLPFG